MRLYDGNGNECIIESGNNPSRYYVPNEVDALSEERNVYYGWDVEGLYNAWDSLMESYPNYITKTVCDYKDSSETYELRRYVMCPESGTYEKTIYIQAGAHGNETAGQLSLLRIAQIICSDEWKANENIAYLRNKVRIVINPLVNPWGKTNTSTATSLGINVNRNYDGMWQKVGGGDGYNSGTYPFQNNENKWVKETIEWIGVDNIHYAFDFHDAGTIEQHGDYWVNFNAFLSESRNRVMQMIEYLCNKNVDGTPNIWHCKDTITYGTFSQWMNKTMGVPASTVEHCYVKLYMDADFMNRSVEVYFNTVIENTIADFNRPLEISNTARFNLNWFSALGEKEFNTTNTHEAFMTIYDLFDTLVDGDYITKSETSVTDTNSHELHYYSLIPKKYSKTVVLYGGLTVARTNPKFFNGILYKVAKLLKYNSSLDRHLNWIRENVRIIIIPYVDTMNTTVSGNSYLDYSGNFTSAGVADETKSSVSAMLTFLNDIGTIDCVIYSRDRFTDDIDSDSTERWIVPSAQHETFVNLVDYLNENGNVVYELAETSGSFGDYLSTKDIKSVRIDSTYDVADYTEHEFDFPSADDTTSLDKTTFIRLNSETARRTSNVVNLIEELCK